MLPLTVWQSTPPTHNDEASHATASIESFLSISNTPPLTTASFSLSSAAIWCCPILNRTLVQQWSWSAWPLAFLCLVARVKSTDLFWALAIPTLTVLWAVERDHDPLSILRTCLLCKHLVNTRGNCLICRNNPAHGCGDTVLWCYCHFWKMILSFKENGFALSRYKICWMCTLHVVWQSTYKLIVL